MTARSRRPAADAANLRVLRLELGTLIALDALLRERNVSKAANRVGMSQPTMSHLLARLRQTFGDPLLVRGSAGLTLTDNGRLLFGQLQRLVPQIEDFQKAATLAPDETQTMLRLACTEHASLAMVPRLHALLEGRAPGAVLKLLTVQARTLNFQRLEESRFDLLVGAFTNLPADWHVKDLYEDHLVVIGGRALHKRRGPLTTERFLAATHVVFSPDERSLQNLVDSVLESKGLKRNIGTYVSTFQMAAAIVAESNRVAMVPSGLARHLLHVPGIRVAPSPIPFPPLVVSMAWHPRSHEEPQQRWFRKLVTEAARAAAAAAAND